MTLPNYLKLLTLIILTSCKTLQTASSNLAGQYISKDTKFEKTSILILTNDSTFVYSYMLGGCQDKINGNWTIVNNSIVLQTKTNSDTVLFHTPDLNKISWTTTKNGIKPNEIIDNGCFKESSLHVKQKNNSGL